MYTHNTPNQSDKSSKRFFRTSSGVTNGVIVGDAFRRDVIRSKHFVWKHGGYGLDAREAERLNAAGIAWVVFIETPEGIEYSICMSDFLAAGIRDQLGGFELQIFIPLSMMSKTSPLNLATVTTAPEYSEPTATNDEAVTPLNIKSRALRPGETKFKKGVKTLKQLRLFGGW